MNATELGKFLDNRKGYIKFGSKKLMEVLESKGHSLVNMTQEDVKEVLKAKARGYSFTPKKKKVKAVSSHKVMIYDIETSMVQARIFGTGKQFVPHNSLADETQILTVAWMWEGEEKVHTLKWGMKKKSDKKLIKAFLEEYNKADMVITWNGNSFDDKIVRARAMKYNLEVNQFVKQFDVMRQVKNKFKLASYSMAYVARYLHLGSKLQHNGREMWETIQWGSKKDAKREMSTMLRYNIQDVVLTFDIYNRIRKYLGHVVHKGVIMGKGKTSCPSCGSDKVKLHSTQVTAGGTVQRVLKCKCKAKFKVSNTEYLKTL